MLLIEGYKAFSLFRPEDRTNILLAPGGRIKLLKDEYTSNHSLETDPGEQAYLYWNFLSIDKVDPCRIALNL